MDGKEALKLLYRTFGEKPKEGQEMFSMANIFYLMGKENDKNITSNVLFGQNRRKSTK